MISLALDREVVASAWEQQPGCGSIFAPHIPDADLAVPDVIALDLCTDTSGGVDSGCRRHISCRAAAAAAAAAAEPFVRTRAEALARYREKRANRTHAKKIRYHLRKVNADRRPRVKGRFVKKGELAEMELAESAAAAADDAACGTGYSVWDEAGDAAALGAAAAAAAAGGGMGCWVQQEDFLQALQLPGMAAELHDAAAAAAAPVPVAAADDVAAAAACGGTMQLFGAAAAMPDNRASAGVSGAEAAAADAMDMHLLGRFELGFGGLDEDAAAPMLGEDFFNEVHHDMTESSGTSQGCLMLH
ncbi:hypothetical protein OEZ86_008012 [Tetradesmus obliquus]|nr:hypothetical protein OEZ86_008012 [Tetradesmus obliquus]